MKKNQLIAFLFILSFTFTIMAVIADGGAEVLIKAEDLGTKTITIDGAITDWEGFASTDLKLEQPVYPDNTDFYTAKVSVAYDKDNIYFLLKISEKYQAYDFSKATSYAHEETVSLALAFNINATNSRHMGASSEAKADWNTTSGTVDIVHWELEAEAGFVYTGSKDGALNKGDGPKNLDDEYSTHTTNRKDDKVDQAWTGAWGHSNPTNGTAGDYYFELKRPLTNDDPNDAQFAMGSKTAMTVAFWTPFETEAGWRGDGHFTSSEVNAFVTVGSGSSPGFEILVTVLALFAAIPVISKIKKN